MVQIHAHIMYDTIYCLDYIIDVIVEFQKMVQIHAHIMYDHNILFGLHNQCYG